MGGRGTTTARGSGSSEKSCDDSSIVLRFGEYRVADNAGCKSLGIDLAEFRTFSVSVLAKLGRRGFCMAVTFKIAVTGSTAETELLSLSRNWSDVPGDSKLLFSGISSPELDLAR
jgi:hypothetical protein